MLQDRALPRPVLPPGPPPAPLKKVGGEFQRFTWGQVFREIAEQVLGDLAEYGPQAILRYNYASTMGLREGSHVHAFFRALGTPELDETICATAGSAAWEFGYGAPHLGVDPQGVPRAERRQGARTAGGSQFRIDRQLSVEYDETRVTPDEIIAAVRDLGYRALPWP